MTEQEMLPRWMFDKLRAGAVESLHEMASVLRDLEEGNYLGEAERYHAAMKAVAALSKALAETVEAWGFNYSTTLVWAKNPIGGGLGGIFGLATEYCLFGRRGSRAEEGRVGRNWWNWRRPYDERGKPRHSAKPAEFFEMVEGVSPGPRLEMFARAPREGWDVWGNEVESNVRIA